MPFGSRIDIFDVLQLNPNSFVLTSLTKTLQLISFSSNIFLDGRVSYRFRPNYRRIKTRKLVKIPVPMKTSKPVEKLKPKPKLDAKKVESKLPPKQDKPKIRKEFPETWLWADEKLE